MKNAAMGIDRRTRSKFPVTLVALASLALTALTMPATGQVLKRAATVESVKSVAPMAANDRLCTAGSNPAYGWFEDQNGKLGVMTPGTVSCLPNTPTALKFESGNGLGLPLADQVEYNLALTRPTVAIPLLEPALCEDYYAGAPVASNWDLVLIDANNDAMLPQAAGVTAVNYAVATRTFRPHYNDMSAAWIQCYSGLAPNAIIEEPTEDPDFLFADGFEAGSNLRVEFLDATTDQPIDDDLLNQGNTPGSSVTFKVRVTNTGNVDAHHVRIREFAPTNSALLSPTVTPEQCVDHAAQAPAPGQSNCAGGTRLEEDILVLAAGAKRVYTLTRQSSGSDTSAGQAMALIQVAAFADPVLSPDQDRSDNSRSLRIQVVDQITVNGVVFTNGQAGGSGGTNTIVTSVPAGCIVSGESATCPPGTTGLKFSAAAGPDYTFTGFGGCTGTSSNVTNTEGTFTTTTSASCTVVANFYKRPTVTASVSGQSPGTISVNSSPVHYNQAALLTVTPGVGYAVDTIAGCGGVTHDSGQIWKTAPVTADCHVTVTFKTAVHTVTASVVGDGSVTPTVVMVQHGQVASFTVTPGLNHKLLEPTGTCPLPGYWFGTSYHVGPITEDCTVEFTFALETYEVTANPDVVNGKIWFLDNGNQVSDTGIDVPHGHTASFNLIPDSGFAFANPAHVTATGCTVADVNYNTATQTWSAVTSAITATGCVISATFTPE